MTAKAKRPRSATENLPPWREVAKPHSDIIQGRFDLSVFAANLYAVHRGTAPIDYREPDRFFQRTFLSAGLQEMAVAVLRRLSGKPGGEPVVDLITSFGGGKTHALIMLYHLAKNAPAAKRSTGVAEVLKEAGADAPTKARVAVLSGEDISPVKGIGEKGEPVRKTLWGELAWQLGGEKAYDVIRTEDEKRIAPTSDDLARLLAGDTPTLILIDEALQYLSRARGEKVHETTLAAQTLNFIKALSDAVSNRSTHACLVVTLPASVAIEINKEDEEDYHRLSHFIHRVERTRQLAQGEEIYEIVRRRLFQDLGPLEARKKVVNAYLDYYRNHADAFPPEVNSPRYASKLEKAYPFHPEFLDALNERWASIPNFQRTRGVLRMLALLISDLYKDDSLPLIHLSSARLSNRDFRAEVLGQIDARQFDSVIDSDIAGTGARAVQVDSEGAETLQREHLSEKAATAVFFYSFGGAAGISAASLPQVRLAVLRPGLEPAFIADVLNSLHRRLYYLNVDGNQYSFTVQPNLNAVRVDLEAQVSAEDVGKIIQAEVATALGGEHFKVPRPFVEEPGDVTDTPSLTLVVLDLEHPWGKTSRSATERLVREVLAGGTTHRSNRNALLFLVAEEGNRVRAEARSRLALDAIERLYGRTGKLSAAQKRELDGMMQSSRKAMQQAIWSAYHYVLTPGEGDGLEEWDLGRLLHRDGRSLQDEAWNHLVERERIAPKLGPSILVKEDFPLWPKEAPILSLKTLKDAWGQYTYLPMIPGVQALKECIAEGVRQGLFGYALGKEGKYDFVYFRQHISPDQPELVENAWLLRADMARQLAGEPAVPGSSEGTPGAGGPGPPVPPGPKPTPQPGTTYKTVVVEGDLDWKKWSDFYEGVVKPLVQAGATVRVHVRMDASAEAGISRNVLEITVTENISQRGLAVRVTKEE